MTNAKNLFISLAVLLLSCAANLSAYQPIILDINCPVCQKKHDFCCESEYMEYYLYNPHTHFPFQYETVNLPPIFHCVNCRFTIYIYELHDLTNNPPLEVPPSDILLALRILKDYSNTQDRFIGRDLPLYQQYEIIEKLLLYGFAQKNPPEYRKDRNLFLTKLYFIQGYLYRQASKPDLSREAFGKSKDYLQKTTNLAPGESSLYKGSIEYFLGHPWTGIKTYEVAMTYDFDIKEDMFRHCFFLNSDEILGPFSAQPFRYVWGMRNILPLYLFKLNLTRLISLLFLGFLFAWLCIHRPNPGLTLSFAHSRLADLQKIFLLSCLSALTFIIIWSIHASILFSLLSSLVWLSPILVNHFISNHSSLQHESGNTPSDYLKWFYILSPTIVLTLLFIDRNIRVKEYIYFLFDMYIDWQVVEELLFTLDNRYIPFWGLSLLSIFVLHYLMAKIFQKSRGNLDYSILTTLLSLIVMALSMNFFDKPTPTFTQGGAYYLLTALLWLPPLIFSERQLKKNSSQRFSYLYANRLWPIIKISMILMPLIYTYPAS